MFAIRLVLSLSCLAFVRQATAQTQDAEKRAALVQQALTQLHSDDLGKVAWGAWTVASNKLEPCLGELRAQLPALAKVAPGQRQFAVLAVLDALIRIDAIVPAADLEPFLEGDTLVPALVLLARRPSENRAALNRLFRSVGDRSQVWVACGNLLATLKDQDFVVELLHSPVYLKVSVVDESPVDRTIKGSAFATRLCQRPPDGYPPVMFYRLGSGAKIADGPKAVHALRTGNLTDCESIPPEGYRYLRRMWLAHMLGEGAPAALIDLEQWVEITWTGPEALVAALRDRRATIERSHGDLVAACLEARLVTAGAVAGIAPVIDQQMDDRRKDRSMPLPDVAAPAKK